jgi:oxygen-dependent protoporphyrinogen oxidase
MKRIESCLKDLPGIFLAGSSYYGIGLPDCIRSGQKAAKQAIEFFQNRHNKNPHVLQSMEA